MKKNTSEKKGQIEQPSPASPSKTTVPLPTETEIVLGVAVPAALQKLKTQSQKDFLQSIIPFNKMPEPANKMLAGAFSGFTETEIPVPEWAKRASRKMFESMGFDFMYELMSDTEGPESSSSLGKMIGLSEQLLKQPSQIPSTVAAFKTEIISPMVDFSKAVASKAEPAESAKFFNGRLAAEKISDQANNLPQRGKIYMLIALYWEQIQQFKSTGEFHKWVLDQKTPEGRLLVAPQTDSREIRKICKEIGLKFQNSWRKPPSEKI